MLRSVFSGLIARVATSARRILTSLLVVSAVFAVTANDVAYAAVKNSAIVVDAHNGKVLFAEDPDGRRYPASLTKMMTLFILFEEMARGRFSLDSEFTVSDYATRQAPSKLGLNKGEKIRVEDAILAIVTKSANDVAVTIAENVAGSESAFAARMTQTAHAIGMRNTNFRNASGLPNPGQYTTARDMAILGLALQSRHPKYFTYFKTLAFNWKGRVIGSHNRLVGRVDGVDGIKTGFINASGFNLVTSMHRDGRRLVGVVMGGATASSRDARMKNLLEAQLDRAQPGAEQQVAEAPQQAAPQPVKTKAPALPPVENAYTAPLAPQPPMPIKTADKQPTKVEPVKVAPQQVAQDDSEDAAPVDQVPPKKGKKGAKVADQPVKSLADATLPAKHGKVKPEPVIEQGDTSATDEPAGWQIQIGAAPNKDGALALISDANDAGGKMLKKAKSYTQVFKHNGSTYYRARFSGFTNEAQATKACSALSKKSIPCFPIKL